MTGLAQAILNAKSFRWGVNTLASLVVNLGLTIGLHEGFAVDPAVAYAIALVTVFLMNFVFFRYYVFIQSEPLPIGSQFMAYTASAIGFRVVEYLSFVLLHTLLGVHYVVTIILVQGLSFVVKFFFYGRLIFRAKNTA